MTVASAAFVSELVALGLERREARWIVDEFAPGGDPAAESVVLAAAERRLAGEPLQYILGHWPFRSLDLDVDPRVLIPRPETEELVDVALGELAGAATLAPLVLDLGCGSGAIGLSVLCELAERGVVASLIAVDADVDALAVARRNALKHRLVAVSFVRSSWYEGLDATLEGRIDLIVANPPYVGAEEYRHLDPVLDHEPYGALVSDDAEGVAGLADLATIISAAPTWLAPGACVVCEHGEDQGEATRELARRAGLVDVRTLNDLAGRERMLVARRPR